MHAIDRKQRLFKNIVRLSHAEREAPGSRDIVAVRTALEEELGETVSRRLAARLLGVSHTALARWINAGDLPLVQDAHGRSQVPVSALLDLYEAVERERKFGRRNRHLLEPTMSEARRRAERIRPADLVPRPAGAAGHDRPERRSLAYHRALARRLRRPMLDEALHLTWKWRDQGRIDPRYAEQWEEVLQRPVSEVRQIISADDSRGRDLRQNSPFAGLLSEPERRRILEEVR
jgi:hypothetical protein